MSDSKSKWEDMREETNESIMLDNLKMLNNPLFRGRTKEPSIEQRMTKLEKRISKQTKLIEEILKTLE